MINKKDFAKLCFNYNKEPNEDLFELWQYNLRCYDEDEIQKTFNIIITNDKFFPTLSRILEVAKDVASKTNIDYDEDYKKNKMVELKVIPKWFDVSIDDINEEDLKWFNDFMEEFRNEHI